MRQWSGFLYEGVGIIRMDGFSGMHIIQSFSNRMDAYKLGIVRAFSDRAKKLLNRNGPVTEND